MRGHPFATSTSGVSPVLAARAAGCVPATESVIAMAAAAHMNGRMSFSMKETCSTGVIRLAFYPPRSGPSWAGTNNHLSRNEVAGEIETGDLVDLAAFPSDVPAATAGLS